MNRATSISHALVGTTRTLAYDYDTVGNRNWLKRDGNLGDAYGYDLADQSTAVMLNIPNPDTSGAGSPTIAYDANGNRTSFAAYQTTDTYTTNNLNQYSARNSTQITYDANGNMTTAPDGSVYTYDSLNRMLTAKKGTGPLNTFTYDGLNRQLSRKVGSGAVYYRVYDGWDLLGEYASGSSTAFYAYLYGATGLVKNVKTNNYYYQDANGSTTHLASNTGALKESYRYDLHGQPIFYNASDAPITGTAYGVRHLFTGQQWYSEVAVYDLRNRYYSPDIGRFLQADPLSFDGGDSNLYRYCGNNPLTRTDPLGQGWIGLFAGAIPAAGDEAAKWYFNSPDRVTRRNSPLNTDPVGSQIDRVQPWTNIYNAGRVGSFIQDNIDGIVQGLIDSLHDWDIPSDPFNPGFGPATIDPQTGQWHDPNGQLLFDPTTNDIGQQGVPGDLADNKVIMGWQSWQSPKSDHSADGSWQDTGTSPANNRGGMGSGTSGNPRGGIELGGFGYGSAGLGSGVVEIGLGGGGSPLETQTLLRMH